MKSVRIIAVAFLLTLGLFAFDTLSDDKIIAYSVDLKKQDLQLYWKDGDGKIIGSLKNLKSHIERQNRTLLFATNGGMYQTDQSPLGLYIENGKMLKKLNRSNGEGNFYLNPNGVFYISGQKAYIVQTENFKPGLVEFATQSGPMLVIDGQIHPAFKEGSTNLNIRNGVGILPDGKVVFAMSKREINFYDFAKYFKGLGCKNALYLDGFVSRTYLPEKNWVQTDGNFGVMIGVTKNKD